MKLSIITATFNREGTIAQSIESLQAQSFEDFEHVVQDGGSTDRTLEIIRQMADDRTALVSERDSGIYDALNRATERATGEAIGLLHSDDFLAGRDVLQKVADTFSDPDVDAVYGDLQYVSKQSPDRVVRNWISSEFSPALLKSGWMPPHPTLFLRRRVIKRHGDYDTGFSIAADYDAVLRYFGQPGFKAVYVPEVFVKMRVGGESNRSLERIIRKSREDYHALRKNGAGGIGVLARKNFSKIGQFF